MDQFGRRQQSRHWPSSFECEFAFITNPPSWILHRVEALRGQVQDGGPWQKPISWILHRVEALRGEIQDGALWQKISLVNIAPGRGSAWSNPRWPAVTKKPISWILHQVEALRGEIQDGGPWQEYCIGSRLCVVKPKTARCDNREYCIGSKRCLMKLKMAGRGKSEYLLFCPNF